MLKKMFYILSFGCLTVNLFGATTLVSASAIEDAGQEFSIGDGTPADDSDKGIDFGKIVKDNAVDPKDGTSEGIQKFLGVDYGDAENQRATYYIKNLINWFLAVIGLIALIVLIYGFYKMFFAKDNADAFKDAVRIVRGAAIALLVIGIAWFIVSMLFDVYFAAKEDIK